MLKQRNMLKIPKEGEKKNGREKEKVDGCQELKKFNPAGIVSERVRSKKCQGQSKITNCARSC